MTDKRQTKLPDEAFNLIGLFRGFDSQALAALQQRNLEAYTRAASLIASATGNIASKQMAMLKEIGELKPELPQPEEGPEGLSGLMHRQMNSGRETMEKAIKQAREMHDTVWECWWNVAGVFEACARDNISFMEEEAQSAGSEVHSAKPKSESGPPQRPQAVSA